MKAIFKREVRSYFSSPVGYVCVSVLMALYGFWYYQAMLTSSSSYISSVFGTMFSFSMMIIPIITMLGKFFACCFVYFVATTLGGILPAIVMSTFSTPSWGEIIGNYIGALLYGAAMISIGVFISSLTVSQIIAAIGTFIISVLLMYMDSLASVVSNEVLSTAIQWFSFNDRYSTFTQGMFSISSVIFFISVVAVFVFLTARKVESRRWS